MFNLEYLPKERKVLINKGIKMSEKMQQQLNYIANAIRDNASTLDLSLLSIKYDIDRGDAYIVYRYSDEEILHREKVLYREIFKFYVKKFSVDDTTIKMKLYNYSHDANSLFKKITQKYFIHDLKVFIMSEMSPNLSKVFDALSPQLGRLTVISYATPKGCNLLSKWISNDNFPKVVHLKLRSAYFILNIPGFSNDDMLGKTDDAFREILSTCKSKQDTLIAFDLCRRGMNDNTIEEFNKLHIYNTERKNLIIESLANIVQGYYRLGEKKCLESKELAQEFKQILENNALKLIWDFKDNPTMHIKILKKLISTNEDKTTYTQKNVEIALIKFCTSIFNKYILPDATGICIEFFKRLPLELQEHIVKFTTSKIFSLSLNKEEPQEINFLQSTTNEVKDLLPKLQEQITEDDIEAAVSDDTAMYGSNTIDQLSEYLLLAGNNQNLCTMPQF